MSNVTDGDDYDVIWKFIAMEGGFKLLRSYFHGGAVNPEADQFFLDLGRSALTRKAGIGNWIRPVKKDGLDIQIITDQALKLIELDIRARELSGGAVPQAQQEILKKCMEAVQVTVIDPDFKMVEPREPTMEELLGSPEPKPTPIALRETEPATAEVEVL